MLFQITLESEINLTRYPQYRYRYVLRTQRYGFWYRVTSPYFVLAESFETINQTMILNNLTSSAERPLAKAIEKLDELLANLEKVRDNPEELFRLGQLAYGF